MWRQSRVPFERVEGPDGPIFSRLPYRAEDYTVHANNIRSFNNWRSGDLPFEHLLELYDGPFQGSTEVDRFERAGKSWIRMSIGEAYIDVEIVDMGLGEIVPVEPATAYQLALEADRQRASRNDR
jgi:hypothetical protein